MSEEGKKVNEQEKERDPKKEPIDLEDLLREIEKPKELNELLNDIIEEEMQQEFALKHVLHENSVGGVVIGCSRPEHVLEAMRAADSIADGNM